MDMLQFLLPIIRGCWDHSTNKPASGQSVRRWLNDGAIHINGFPVGFNEQIDMPIFSIVLHPNNLHKKVTLW